MLCGDISLPGKCCNFLNFMLDGREPWTRTIDREDAELTQCELFPVLSRALSQIFVAKISCLSPASFISNHERDKSGIDNG